jgi:hypothetical protein
MILRLRQSNPNFVESEEALRLAAKERFLKGNGVRVKEKQRRHGWLVQ